jgi:hypothetical protein
VYIPGAAIAYARPEVSYARQVNAMGLTDKEFTADKAPGEYRIVALGDSFTEGVGADTASTWVKPPSGSSPRTIRPGYELMGRAIARHIWEAGLVAPPGAGRP